METSLIHRKVFLPNHSQKVAVYALSMPRVALKSMGAWYVCLASSLVKCLGRFLFFPCRRREAASSEDRMHRVVGKLKIVTFHGILAMDDIKLPQWAAAIVPIVGMEEPTFLSRRRSWISWNALVVVS